MLGSRRGAIGTRLLNLNAAASDHPEPLVQDIGRAAYAGNYLFGGRGIAYAMPRPSFVGDAVAVRYWLMKSEPEECSIDMALAAPNSTVPWTGVRNYTARNYMRDSMQVGDGVLFYHSSTEVPGIYGLAEVASKAYPDETQFDRKSHYYDAKSTRAEPRWVHVDIRAVKKTRVLPLPELRSQPQLEEMIVLRRGNRLSITPVTPAEWRHIQKLLAT